MIEFIRDGNVCVKIIYKGMHIGTIYNWEKCARQISLHGLTDTKLVEQILTKMKALQDTACNMQGEKV